VQRYETAHELIADDENDFFNGNLGGFDPLWIDLASWLFRFLGLRSAWI